MAERAVKAARTGRDASPSRTSALPATLQTVVSRPAKRAYIGSIFFLLIAPALLGVSVVSYWVFYFNFVPQVSFELPVHLQFGHDHPSGIATIGSKLVPLQAYDVSVVLQLPTDPRNVAAGNFMVDLKLFSPPNGESYASGPKTTTKLAESRRPAIMTFASPMVDTARRLVRLPFYVFGWRHEAESMRIPMMERIEFSKEKGKVPGSLGLEISHPWTSMLIYAAIVRFDARFTGLRWVMYKWRILSFLVFSSTFWVVSMMATVAVWMALSSSEEGRSQLAPSKSEDDGDGEDLLKTDSDEDENDSIKTESDEERGNMPSHGNTHGRRWHGEQEKEVENEEEAEEPPGSVPRIWGTSGQRVDEGHAATTQSRFGEGQAVQRRREQS